MLCEKNAKKKIEEHERKKEILRNDEQFLPVSCRIVWSLNYTLKYARVSKQSKRDNERGMMIINNKNKKSRKTLRTWRYVRSSRILLADCDASSRYFHDFYFSSFFLRVVNYCSDGTTVIVNCSNCYDRICIPILTTDVKREEKNVRLTHRGQAD